jgi:hypothetical protein
VLTISDVVKRLRPMKAYTINRQLPNKKFFLFSILISPIISYTLFRLERYKLFQGAKMNYLRNKLFDNISTSNIVYLTIAILIAYA